MPFPAAIAKAQKDALLQDVIEALDDVEALRTRILDVEAHLVGLDSATFADVQQKINTAYNALCSARNALGDAA